jgi:hypothetical protein
MLLMKDDQNPPGCRRFDHGHEVDDPVPVVKHFESIVEQGLDSWSMGGEVLRKRPEWLKED